MQYMLKAAAKKISWNCVRHLNSAW